MATARGKVDGMNLVEIGKLSARVVGGDDRQGGGTGPVVVLLHGFGAPGSDLVSLHRVIDAPPGTRWVFPEAPIALGGPFGDGRAWWQIDMAELQSIKARNAERELTDRNPVGIELARDALSSFLDALPAKLNVDPKKIVLGGFSQGAMLSLDNVLRDAERPLAGLVLMSGSIVGKPTLVPLFPKRKSLPVFASHGREDPVLPFSIADGLVGELKTAGYSVDWVPFRGGHGIGDPVVAELGKFLRRVLE